jgi:uncharacterized membrane protein
MLRRVRETVVRRTVVCLGMDQGRLEHLLLTTGADDLIICRALLLVPILRKRLLAHWTALSSNILLVISVYLGYQGDKSDLSVSGDTAFTADGVQCVAVK